MERVRRGKPTQEEPPLITRAKRESWSFIRVPAPATAKGAIPVMLSYRRSVKDREIYAGKVEVRWYYAGTFDLCFVEVFEPNASPAGNFVVRIASRGNKGIGFPNEKELHAWLIDELAKLPG